MPRAKANETGLMEERLRAVLNRKQTELETYESSVKQLRSEVNELKFILGGSENGTRENITKLQKEGLKPNRNSPDWTPAEDAAILHAARVPISISQLANTVIRSKVLKGRTAGSLKQRIYRLATTGKLNRTKKAGPGVSGTVEAA